METGFPQLQLSCQHALRNLLELAHGYRRCLVRWQLATSALAIEEEKKLRSAHLPLRHLVPSALPQGLLARRDSIAQHLPSRYQESESRRHVPSVDAGRATLSCHARSTRAIKNSLHQQRHLDAASLRSRFACRSDAAKRQHLTLGKFIKLVAVTTLFRAETGPQTMTQ